MSELIYKEASKLSQDVIIEMFELDLQRLGLGIFRFSTTSLDGASISFNGSEYLPAPIEASGFAWDGAGTLPRPTLKMAAKDLSFLNLVFDADDLVGMPVRRIKTFRKYLDDGSHPGAGISFPVDHFVVERKASQSRHSLAFELSTSLDQQGVKLPKLMILRDTCVQTYRYWTGTQFQYKGVSCPYTGSNYFKQNGEVTSVMGEDACGKRISDCKLRFGDTAILPRLAFPGVGRY
jgi:lambda family phage minor tail protein L